MLIRGEKEESVCVEGGGRGVPCFPGWLPKEEICISQKTGCQKGNSVVVSLRLIFRIPSALYLEYEKHNYQVPYHWRVS